MAWQKRNMFSSAVDMQKGGAVPWPNYQMGGEIMPTQLFEEGDQDINMALNNMAGMTNPSIEQIKDTEMPMVGDEMTMDQGPASFEEALGLLKQNFYDEIASYVTKSNDMGQIEQYLKGISVAYSNELDKLKKEFDIVEVHPDEELLTPEFIIEIQNMVGTPEMLLGGLVKTEADLEEYGIPLPWQVWVLMSEEEKDNAMKMSLAARAGGTAADTGVDNTAMMKRVNEIIKERTKLAKRSAEMPLTKQGGFGGFAEQMNAYRANQAAAQDKVLADELDLIQYGQNRYDTRGTGKKSNWTAALQQGIFPGPEDAVIDPVKIYEQATDAAKQAIDPATYVIVHLAQGGHQGLVEIVDASLGAIKNLDERPINFSDFVAKKRMEALNAAQEWDILSGSAALVSEFLSLPDDKPNDEG